MSEKKSSRWKPGQTGNPKGRPPGQSEIAKMRAALTGDVPAILAALVETAKTGDVQAARLVLERVLPPLRPTEEAVTLQLPGDGALTAKAAAVLDAAAAGVLAPGQASQLISALGAMAKISEIDELAARVSALEAQHGDA